MLKSKMILISIVVIISAAMTIMTMYVYGLWQHDRYWTGTIQRVNKIESSVYAQLLSADLNKIYSSRDFDKLREILKPLDGKLIIKLTDTNGDTVFESSKARSELGTILQQSQVKSGVDTFFIQIISCRPPSWHSEYMKWFSNCSEWFSSRYDRITMPSIFFFLIWGLFITSIIWRYKAHLENDRLFHVLREFKGDKDEEERK